MTPAQAIRLFHTMRYLRPEQVLYRAKYTFLPRAHINRHIGRPLPLTERAADPVTFAPSADEYLGGQRFRFLNREGDLAGGWQNPEYERLWLYNLHYFNYLNQPTRKQHAGALAQLIDAWIVANPIGAKVGWEPYPLSLRIVNWVKWACTGHALADNVLTSLYLQARYLARRLEYHLLGNHLFANAKALVFVGLFFDTPEASGWFTTGLMIMRRELARQVLSDGGHFELSPMYHAIFVEDLLDIVNLADGVGRHRRGGEARACAALAREPLPRMLDWLNVMTHPDGDIAQFNDAAFGVAQPLSALVEYAQRLGVSPPVVASSNAVKPLSASGYVRAECGEYVALLDVARIGPDHLPGHAHADTLSFELSLAGRRLIIDAGTSTYSVSEQRAHERSTPAHNTVTYRSRNSSDVWSAFRVGRRAYPIEVDTQVPDGIQTDAWATHGGVTGKTTWRVSAAHTGYTHLPERVVHRRTWHGEDVSLVIVDQLEDTRGRAIKNVSGTFATLRFAPGLDVTETPDGLIVVSEGLTPLCQISHTGSTARILDDFHYPRFGVKTPCKLLRVSLVHATFVTRFSFKTFA